MMLPPPRARRAAPVVATLLILIGLATAPAGAQTIVAVSPEEGHYRLEMLSADQRRQLLEHVERYAIVEAFLKACGRRPALESRFRQIVRGCIHSQSVNTIASHFRRAVSSRAGLRWDCTSPDGRRMIARTEQAIQATVADVSRLCRRS